MAPLALLEAARCHGASVEPPPFEVAVFVVGDEGCGKSSFVNGFAQELLLPLPSAPGAKAPPLSWVRSASASVAMPPLLAAGAAQFPGVLEDVSRCMAGSVASARLDAVDLVEVSARALADPALSEAVAWMAARGGLVLCLADSQRQRLVSADAMAFLKRVTAQAPQSVQLVLSKVDLVARESDRIRLTAKVSKLASEGLGRAFEVLPVSRKGSREVLLEALGAVPQEVLFSGRAFRAPPSEAPLGDMPPARAASHLSMHPLSRPLAKAPT